jgi:hypothetical protein
MAVTAVVVAKEDVVRLLVVGQAKPNSGAVTQRLYEIAAVRANSKWCHHCLWQ